MGLVELSRMKGNKPEVPVARALEANVFKKETHDSILYYNKNCQKKKNGRKINVSLLLNSFTASESLMNEL